MAALLNAVALAMCVSSAAAMRKVVGRRDVFSKVVARNDQCLPDAKIGMELTFTSLQIIQPESTEEAVVEMIPDEETRNKAKQLMVDSHSGKRWANSKQWGFAGGLLAVKDLVKDNKALSDKFDLIGVADTKLDAMQRFKALVEKVCVAHGCKVTVPKSATLYVDKEGKPLSTRIVEGEGGDLLNAVPAKFLKFKVSYTDGFWWSALIDSWCLEVNSMPVSAAVLMPLQDMLQRHIWDTAKEAGLVPHPRIGNGHIHFDVASTFGTDEHAAAALRNFIVDYENHPSFPLSVFGDIRDNAPPLAILKQVTRDNFKKVIEAFDGRQDTDYRTLVDALNVVYLEDTYMNGDDGRPDWAWRDRPEYGFKKGQSKYHSLNLLPLRGPKIEDEEIKDGIGTIEIRGLRPQRTAQDLVDQVVMVHCRAKLMRDMAMKKNMVEYENKDYLTEVGRQMPEEDILFDRPEVLHDEAKTELKDYLEGAGLSYDTYKRLFQFQN